MKLQKIANCVKKLIDAGIKTESVPSIFIWGPPGIGKSTVVANLARELKIGFVDVRLSQLAPTDLRGLPSVNAAERTVEWIAPNFLPRDKSSMGILFLDEFNMASSSIMGIAQQLILDRKVGDYTLPPKWIIIGAGNRASDRAAVNEMPSPVSNRFLHFDATIELEDFKDLIYNHFEFSDNTKANLVGFLNFRPELLHKNDRNCTSPAWPSPRTWQMAGQLNDLDMDITHAVGDSAAVQFYAYLKVFGELPNIEDILEGKKPPMSKKTDPSSITAVISSLLAHAKDPDHYCNALSWLINVKEITEDYTGLYLKDMILKLEKEPAVLSKALVKANKQKETKEFMAKYKKLITNFGA